jgi:outer membrane protein OmpA-like peptidoglycan-associated protein
MSDRMSRSNPTGVRRSAALCAWIVIAFAMPAASPTHAASVAQPVAAPAKLSLENATPLPVPSRPSLSTPPKVKAPPRFVSPIPFEPPALPELVEGPAKPAPRPTQTAKIAPAVAPTTQAPNTATPLAPAPTAATPPASGAPTQTAALPPASAAPPATVATPPASALSLVFNGAATTLPDAGEAMVDDIIKRLRASDTARLQLRSYASGTAETAREARQLSLARALSLRERLTAFGVRSSRVDVRALGVDTLNGGSADRIDIEFLNE